MGCGGGCRARSRVASWTSILILSLVGLGCGKPETPPQRPPPADTRPDHEAWGWTTVLTEEGRKRAAISAAHFQKFVGSEKTTLDDGISVIFYNAVGSEPVSRLTAREAEIDERTGNMVVVGEVLLISRDSIRLETDTLLWRREDRTITGPGKVVIRRPDGLETGVGFQASSDLKQWTLRQVATRFGRTDTLRR